ncbi:cyanophycinase [Roseisolibacter agri]|uniref:Cyanophycinase n=1 Tax=Roseisolibacter agri TaxID=2014610 RepID=A0AA37Q8S2_9BACT|nr:cyanophycinase [Roseisolibacter agri]GLC25141.1 cyanophycinase [Roseisolibacter agri]
MPAFPLPRRNPSGRLAGATLLALVVAGCATGHAGTARVSAAGAPAVQGRGTLFVVGGGPQPPALVQEFVTLAGGSGRARIVVFAMASAEGATSGEAKAADLRTLGARATNVWVTREQANTDSVAALLDGATGIWFGGGDQSRLTAALRGTKTEAAIRRRYEGGAVVGGTSAGAAVMSARMITGDERRPGGDRPVKDDGFMTIARDNIILDAGFGLLDDAVVDQHFLRRKRHNRLMSVVLERAPHLGVGIDESTALVIEPDGRWRVSGASAVVVYDARRAAVTPAGTTLGATGMTVHVLPAGSRFDPRTGSATLPSGVP